MLHFLLPFHYIQIAFASQNVQSQEVDSLYISPTDSEDETFYKHQKQTPRKANVRPVHETQLSQNLNPIIPPLRLFIPGDSRELEKMRHLRQRLTDEFGAQPLFLPYVLKDLEQMMEIFNNFSSENLQGLLEDCLLKGYIQAVQYFINTAYRNKDEFLDEIDNLHRRNLCATLLR